MCSRSEAVDLYCGEGSTQLGRLWTFQKVTKASHHADSGHVTVALLPLTFTSAPGRKAQQVMNVHLPDDLGLVDPRSCVWEEPTSGFSVLAESYDRLSVRPMA